MKPKVWTEVPLHPDALARLQAVADVAVGGNRSDLPGALVAVIGASTVDDAFIDDAGPGLKMVIRHGVGYDTVNVPVATARGVLAAYTPEGPTESTAEHAVGLMFAVAKEIARSDRVLHTGGGWANAKFRGVELLDKTVGIVGYGRIGRRVAEMCANGIRMNAVIFDSVLPADAKLASNVSRVDTLEELLTVADVLTLHTPLSGATRHLIGEAQLRTMKPNAIVINTSRGGILDEHALLRVLRDGHLHGAGLDVFEIEPAAADNPLCQLDNVIVTPHIASSTDEGIHRMSTGVVDQTLQVLRGERPSFLIDETVWPGRMQPA